MAKKFVPIVLDKTRNLRYGMVAMTKIERKLGKPFSSINFDGTRTEKVTCPECGEQVEVDIADGSKGITYEEIAVVIWAGLVHEDDKLTPDSVATLIDDYSDIPTVMAAMGEAMQEAFGTGKNVQGTADIPSGTGTQPSETPSNAG